jgi:hypothetical protein
MRTRIGLVAALATLWGGAALAQVPPDIAAQLKAIGPRVEIAKTGALYLPLVPKEPYAGVSVTRDLSYGPDDRNKFDVFTSAAPGGGKPILIFVSGGGFVASSRRVQGLPFYDNVMLWAVSNGMVGVNMSYRVAPANKWPSGVEDVRPVVAWAKANAARYGGDPNRIFLWGHSAGASHVGDYVSHPEVYGAASPGVVGAIMSSGRYQASTSDPVSPYYGDAATAVAHSSLPGLVKGGTPIFINTAELDPDMFHVQAELLNDALCHAGRCPTYVKLKDASHISETFAVGTSDTSLSAPVLAFIKNVK